MLLPVLLRKDAADSSISSTDGYVGADVGGTASQSYAANIGGAGSDCSGVYISDSPGTVPWYYS